MTEKGIVVVQTSTDATVVKALQDHAAQATDFAQRVWAAPVVKAERMVESRQARLAAGIAKAFDCSQAHPHLSRTDHRLTTETP